MLQDHAHYKEQSSAECGRASFRDTAAADIHLPGLVRRSIDAGKSNECLFRAETLRRMGFDPYIMVYERPTAPPITRHLQRWVNNKRIFRTVEHFADYEPVKKLGGDG